MVHGRGQGQCRGWMLWRWWWEGWEQRRGGLCWGLVSQAGAPLGLRHCCQSLWLVLLLLLKWH